ncbi:MAG: PQQ-binding-like beta-propeller repeat protein [Planctomycetales bacterium]|nr:PQQ-binding-like beta-propeller repeat protein [Planctomycetales bacterium]
MCLWSGRLGTTQADWPTFQHDGARSGATTEKAPVDPVHLWEYKAPARPQSAWDEPALWDGWSKVHNLTNRQVFDKAFHVAIVGDALYFGSSVDNKVYCLDAQTGAKRWEYYTEGPVRLAPTVDEGRVYVGSDDGYVYCLAANDGNLIWKTAPGGDQRRIPGNGRIVSPWAIRTGVVVQSGRVYCGAGVIPSETVYVCSLDATTGAEVWKTPMNDLPAQGYLLASPSRLYVVTGRDRPLVFDTANGKLIRKLEGGTGGTYALLVGDSLIYGPNKTGEVSLVNEQAEDVLATFAGQHMIVAQPFSYLYGEKHLSALDRQSYVEKYSARAVLVKQQSALKKLLEKKPAEAPADAKEQITSLGEHIEAITKQLPDCVKWRTACDCPISLIFANGVLVAGGDGRIMAVSTESGEELWHRDVPGKVYGLAVVDGYLYASTDEGAIHCFGDKQLLGDVQELAMSADVRPVRLQEYLGPFANKKQPPAGLHGPFAEFIAPGTVRIDWETDEPTTSELEFGVGLNEPKIKESKEYATKHSITVTDVQRDIVYRYQVGGQTESGNRLETDFYLFDAHFDYLPIKPAERPSPYADDDDSKADDELSQKLVELAGTRRGYGLVAGAVDGRLAYYLARNSDLQLIVVEPDADRVQRIRKSMDEAGYSGTRVTVLQRPLDDLQFGPYLFNLIVSESGLREGRLPTASDVSLYRYLRPQGGTLVYAVQGSAPNDAAQTAYQDVISASDWQATNVAGVDVAFAKRGALAGVGEWTHQYASPDNASCSADQRVQGELAVQWWGRPGARPMPDRGNRNPPPVSAHGRLYIQGNRTLFSVDAYNGTILWSKQIPTMRRANMPRDGSNMVADADHVWVAIGDRCVGFNGQTGERSSEFKVPQLSPAQSNAWGYVSRVGGMLVGSGVRPGSQYSGDAGEWYETFGSRDVARVTSDDLFAMNAYDGQLRWNYHQGVIMNSTITIAGGRIYFIESRSEAAKKSESGRMLAEVLTDQVLVALEEESGKVVWERPFDFSKCASVTYMTSANGVLLVTGTDTDAVFHTYAFKSSDGEPMWQHDAPDKKGHHTGHLAHPTIVDDRVYFNKHTYALKTGEVLGVEEFNWHGCGVMSASSNAIFSRYEYHGMFDLATKQRTEMFGLRSGCWLSLIPSGGLLLAPETSAGCSCGHALQTSIAYVPKADLQGK